MSNGLDYSGLGAAWRRILSVTVFGVLPAILALLVLAWTYDSSTFLSDFHGDLYSAGKAILAGHDPYRSAFLSRLAAVARAGGHPSTVFAVPVYPAPALLASVPLALLPYHAAGLLFTTLSILSFAAGLWLLGVRDWRCFGAAFLSWPSWHSLRLGQVNGFLILGAAIIWRYRDRVLEPAIGLAAVVVGKVLLWPLGLFLALTRRWKALALAVVLGALVSLVSWALIGFDGFSSYPRMLSDLAEVEGRAGVSVGSFAAAAGIPGAALPIMVGASAVLVGLAWAGLRSSQEASAYGLLLVAGLTSSSLVWPHYLTLLYVPIALLSPSLGALWLVPLLAYIAPVELTHHSLSNILPYLAIELIVVAALCRPILAALAGVQSGGTRPTRRRPAGRLVDWFMASDRPRFAHTPRHNGRLKGHKAPY